MLVLPGRGRLVTQPLHVRDIPIACRRYGFLQQNREIAVVPQGDRIMLARAGGGLSADEPSQTVSEIRPAIPLAHAPFLNTQRTNEDGGNLFLFPIAQITNLRPDLICHRISPLHNYTWIIGPL